MNVLLIDDDRFVVSALEKKIDWDSLSITEVLTAFNIRQAQKIMESTSIDICVCDIEMPGGSGLDLLSWVRESGFETQFIFLTSYADFDYAKKAIELSSLDYQLKPINFDTLYQILEKAVQKVKKAVALSQTKADSKKWQNNYQHIIDSFWKEFFTNSLFCEPSVLESELRKKDLPYQEKNLFLPILLKLYPGTELFEQLTPAMIDFSFCNIATETLKEACILYESIVTLDSCQYILLIPDLCLEEIKQPLSDSLLVLFHNLKLFLKCDISCCISPEVPLLQLPGQVTALRSMQEANLDSINTPLFLSDYVPQKSVYNPPSLDVIDTFLKQHNARAAFSNLENYLEKSARQNGITKEFLLHLRLDIEQVVFAYLQENGIEAHTLFSNEKRNQLHEKSLESVSYLLDYLQYMIFHAVDYNDFVSEEVSVIDLVLNYIHQHYAEDITRTMLADMVFLNPDYMARLFKKQTNTSIINYITSYRMEKAKEFLQNPDIPIGTVASKVGYGNYSYFSKLFKDVVGCSPNEYRKRDF